MPNSPTDTLLSTWEEKASTMFAPGGLVCINKPYGVGSTSVTSNKPVVHKINTALIGDTNYYMADVLPELAKRLKYDKLEILKMAQRYASGIAVLSSKPQVSARIAKSRLRSKPLQIFTEKYWVITDGVPLPRINERKLGIKLENSTLNDNKHPMIVEDWSTCSVKRQEVKIINVSHRTIYVGPKGCASLVEVCVSGTRWNFLRVYFTWLMSPILGDNLFSSRVRTVLNRRMRVHPDSDSARLPQNLSEEMLSKLNLRPGQEVLIPTHIHLRELTLLNYFGKNKNLVLTAPMPEIFSWTCAQIGMDVWEDEDAPPATELKITESASAAT